jgi:hypothetical protein
MSFCQKGTVCSEHKTARFIIGVILLVLLSGAIFAQSEEVGPERSDAPEDVVEFYKTFLSLYMDNHVRINNLEAVRSAGSDEKASELASEIRTTTDETLSTLRDLSRASQAGDVSNRVLGTMEKTLRIYPIYIDKIVTDWEPSKQQILQRRRLSESEIIRRDPTLATPSLLRRVFLGELMSGVDVSHEMRSWLNQRITRVKNWIGSTYNDLFPLYERLLSRVQSVLTSDEASQEKKEQVVTDVRNEWEQFWTDMGDGSSWQDMRNSVSRLRSLFRGRSNYLPGSQEHVKENVSELQKQIGDLSQLHVQEPFVNRENRLRMTLRLCDAFVKRARRAGLDGEGQTVTSLISSYLTDFVNRTPEEYWNAEQSDQLEQKRKTEIQGIQTLVGTLKGGRYKSLRKQYEFPFDAVMQIVKRLGVNYGKQEQELANNIRDIAQFVQSRYYISTEGLELMKSYRDALEDQQLKNPKQYVKFEQGFRNEHQSRLRNASRHMSRLKRMETEIDGRMEGVEQINPDEFVSARYGDSESE